MLSLAELHQLQRWNTPTIYNGWEQITRHDVARAAFNLEEVRDFMPQMGPMVGYAVTLVIEPSNKTHKTPANVAAYRRYVAEQPGPKVVVIQDRDKPAVLGSFWGEVNASAHRALGCVGTITDGSIRDLDEMTAAGFKALARRLSVGHAYAAPVRWGCEVEVFGTPVRPGQLIHADKHGFLAVPPEDEAALLDAATFMDANECKTVIASAKGPAGRPIEDVLADLGRAGEAFRAAAKARFGRGGEH
jgi:4-hydroxy-4-methyl-2-oxoglutarate aldolase